MRKKEWFVLIACIISIACSCVCSFGEECSFIRENTLRLHILANSDSPADQALKLKIRDAVLSHSGELFSGCDTRQKMVGAAQEQLSDIQRIAEQTAMHNGYDLPVTVSVTDMFFETRRYDNVLLPAGTYTAVRIELGEAAGKNWWCVLFPTLCVPASSAGFEAVAVSAGMPEDLSHTLSGQTPDIRFRLLDWLGEIKCWLNG